MSIESIFKSIERFFGKIFESTETAFDKPGDEDITANKIYNNV